MIHTVHYSRSRFATLSPHHLFATPFSSQTMTSVSIPEPEPLLSTMWHDASLGGAGIDGPDQRVVPNHFFPPPTQRWEFPLACHDTWSPPSSQHLPSFPAPPREWLPSGQQRHDRQPQSQQGWPSQAMTSLPHIDNPHGSFLPTPAPPRFSTSRFHSASHESTSQLSMLTRDYPYRPPHAEEVLYSQFGSVASNLRDAAHGGASHLPHPLHSSPSPIPHPNRVFMASAASFQSPARAWPLSRQTQPSPVLASNESLNSIEPNSLPLPATNTSEGPRGLLAASAAATTVTSVAASLFPVSALAGVRQHSNQSSRSSSTSKQRKAHTRCNRGCLTCRARHKKCSVLKYDDDLDADGQCSACVRLEVQCLQRYGERPPGALQNKVRMKELTAVIAQHTKRRPRHQGPTLRLEDYCYPQSAQSSDIVPPRVTSLIPSAVTASVPANPNAEPLPVIIVDSVLWPITNEGHVSSLSSHSQDTAPDTNSLLNVSTYTLPPGPDMLPSLMHHSQLLLSPARSENSQCTDSASSWESISTLSPAIQDGACLTVNVEDHITPALDFPDVPDISSRPFWDESGHFQEGACASGSSSGRDWPVTEGSGQTPDENHGGSVTIKNLALANSGGRLDQYVASTDINSPHDVSPVYHDPDMNSLYGY